MLNLALVNGFSPALGNSFPVMTFGSRTGQFGTINGLAIGNPFDCAQAPAANNSAPHTPLRISPSTSPPPHPSPPCPTATAEAEEGNSGGWKRASGIPDAQELLAGTDPHDPASVLRITHLEKSAAGMQMQFLTNPGKTYRLEYTDDLKTPWQLPKDNIPGTGQPVTIPRPIGPNDPPTLLPPRGGGAVGKKLSVERCGPHPRSRAKKLSVTGLRFRITQML